MAERRTHRLAGAQEPTQKRFHGQGGIELLADTWGDPTAPPVLFLHGGGQTRHAWGNAGAAVAAKGWFAVSLEARGHGDSAWSLEGRYTLDDFAADYREVRMAFDRRPVVIGASLGGLTVMLAEGESEAPVARGVVLVDIAPTMEADGVQRVLTFMGAHMDGFASLQEAADAIAAYRPHRPKPKDLSGLAKNLRQDGDGRFRWHWDPQLLSRFSEPNLRVTPERLTGAAQGLRVPTMLVRGASSDVISEAGARDFLRLVPHASYVDVAEAGHMVAGDRNDAFIAAIEAFLTRIDALPEA